MRTAADLGTGGGPLPRSYDHLINRQLSLPPTMPKAILADAQYRPVFGDRPVNLSTRDAPSIPSGNDADRF